MLFWRTKKDVKAPRNINIDYVPCDKYIEKFREHSLLVEVSETGKQNQLAIQDKFYPTGNYWVINKEKGFPKKMLIFEKEVRELGLYKLLQ